MSPPAPANLLPQPVLRSVDRWNFVVVFEGYSRWARPAEASLGHYSPNLVTSLNRSTGLAPLIFQGNSGRLECRVREGFWDAMASVIQLLVSSAYRGGCPDRRARPHLPLRRRRWPVAISHSGHPRRRRTKPECTTFKDLPYSPTRYRASPQSRLQRRPHSRSPCRDRHP